MGLVSDFTFFVGHIPCFSQIMSNHGIHSHQVMEKSISLYIYIYILYIYIIYIYIISINIYSSYMFSHLIVPSIFPFIPFIPLDLPVAPRHSSRGPALHGTVSCATRLDHSCRRSCWRSWWDGENVGDIYKLNISQPNLGDSLWLFEGPGNLGKDWKVTRLRWWDDE